MGKWLLRISLVLAALLAAPPLAIFLVGPWTGRNPVQYTIAGVLILVIAAVIWKRTADKPAPVQGAPAGGGGGRAVR